MQPPSVLVPRIELNATRCDKGLEALRRHWEAKGPPPEIPAPPVPDDVIDGLFSAFVLGAVVGIVLLVSRRARRGSHIPFGPFLLIGAAIGLFAPHSLPVFLIPGTGLTGAKIGSALRVRLTATQQNIERNGTNLVQYDVATGQPIYGPKDDANLAALAEFIRELIVQGTHEGIAAARARGQRLGRPL